MPDPSTITGDEQSSLQERRVIMRVDRVAVMLTAVVPESFEPFALPRIPHSTLAWCGAVSTLFRRRRRACLAIVLLVDRSLRRWVPLIPTQTGGGSLLSWSVIASDFADLPPHLLIAGSFQSVARGDLFDAQRWVPLYDGVHFVDQRSGRGRPRRSYVFLRAAGGEAELLADPASVLSDDVAAALREAAGRVRVIDAPR